MIGWPQWHAVDTIGRDFWIREQEVGAGWFQKEAMTTIGDVATMLGCNEIGWSHFFGNGDERIY